MSNIAYYQKNMLTAVKLLLHIKVLNVVKQHYAIYETFSYVATGEMHSSFYPGIVDIIYLFPE